VQASYKPLLGKASCKPPIGKNPKSVLNNFCCVKGHGPGQPWSYQGQLNHGHGSSPSFVSLEKPSMPIVHFVPTTRIKGLLKGTKFELLASKGFPRKRDILLEQLVTMIS
jgi:hypothetical protein